MAHESQDTLRQRLIGESADRIRFYKTDHGALLHVGIHTCDGDGKETGAYIFQSSLGLIVTDRGSAYESLAFDDVVPPEPTRFDLRHINEIARAFRVVFDPADRSLKRRASLRDVTDVVHRICAASIALDAWRFFR